MPKARMELAALRRDGWVEVRQRGSHRLLRKGHRTTLWAFHDGSDIGTTQLRLIARDCGYTVDELRGLL